MFDALEKVKENEGVDAGKISRFLAIPNSQLDGTLSTVCMCFGED